jgi:hypothetical protein
LIFSETLNRHAHFDPAEKASKANDSIEKLYSERAIQGFIEVIVRVKLILTPPAELILAKRAFHKLASTRPLNQHMTTGAFLSHKTLVQIA